MSDRPPRSAALVLGASLVMLVACGSSQVETSTTPASSGSTPARAAASGIKIAAAGDIACASAPHGASDPDHCQYDATSKLLVHEGFARILALGDNQYDVGAYDAYLHYYDAWWGRVKRKTSPVPGNHEYAQDPSATPRGYFRYFGDRVKGPDALGFYSFDLPKGCTAGDSVCWHVIALSSELCFGSGGCGPATDPDNPGRGNRMYAWLKADLLAHPQSSYPCTLAFWHHPLFSVSAASGGSTAIRPLWRLLYRAHADVVLNGHSHNYQRWRAVTPGGRSDPGRGIREFIVGTGGASKYGLRTDLPGTLQVAQNRSFGVLALHLDAEGYSWAWRTAKGQRTFRDRHPAEVPCA